MAHVFRYRFYGAIKRPGEESENVTRSPEGDRPDGAP
jgi:hypothetical protein